MPPSSHLLQPLDLSIFSVLKRVYDTQISENIRVGINHIDKRDFLAAYKIIRPQALSESLVRSAFEALGLVPFNPERVLDTIRIRPYTPPDAPPLNAPQWDPTTPHDLQQLEQQVHTMKTMLERHSKSPPAPTDRVLNQLVKGCQMAMQNAVLLSAENERLRKANERQKHERMLKRRFVSKATTLTIAEANQLIISLVVAYNKQDKVVQVASEDVEDESDDDPTPQIICYVCVGYDHYVKDGLKLQY